VLLWFNGLGIEPSRDLLPRKSAGCAGIKTGNLKPANNPPIFFTTDYADFVDANPSRQSLQELAEIELR
jgi:hypothetical protein